MTGSGFVVNDNFSGFVVNDDFLGFVVNDGFLGFVVNNGLSSIFYINCERKVRSGTLTG